MDISDDGTWMPCLGRTLQLGALYDCCTDNIAFGNSIWDEKTIQDAQIPKTNKSILIEYAMCIPHNIDKKASCLGISDELYLSCALGNIKLDGEARFFNDDLCSKNTLRHVALKCYSSSKVIQFNKSKLKSLSAETFEQQTATHAITGVEYGAISIIVLFQKIQGKYDIKAVDENLKAKANYLKDFISGDCPKMFNVQNNSENISCRVYSTLHITYKIETYIDAVNHCEDLFKLHTDQSTHTPIRVFLSPLKKISKRFTKCARTITDVSLISEVKCIHDMIISVNLDINNLQVTTGTTTLQCITEQIKAYSKSSDQLKSEFTKTLGNMVAKYRNCDIEESLLKEAIKDIYDKVESLHSLTQNKLKEVQQICLFIEAVKDYDLIYTVSEVDVKYEYVICLEFNTGHLIDFELPANTSSWYQDKKIIATVRHKIRQFLKCAKENSTNEGLKFAISEFSDKTCSELAVIRFYHDTEILTFEPPTPPGKPVESQKTESSITITWSAPKNGAQFINSYRVYICKADNSEWSAKCTATDNTAIIKNLEANTRYLFKISATTTIFSTMESQVSEVICTAEQESFEPKTGRKKLSSKSKSNTLADGQIIPANSKANSPHSKAATIPSKQRKDSKATNKDTAQAAKMQSKNAVNKKTEKISKVSATPTPTDSAHPNSSVIQCLYQIKKCERLNDKSLIYKLSVTDVYIKPIESYVCNFGKHNEQLPEKVILLVGATGAGKTTLVNGMINYIFGVKWEDPERMVLAENPVNQKGINQAVSQTKYVNIYKVNHSKHDQLSYNLTIIDTPGFADTDGLSKDQTIMIKIQALLTSNKVIDHIDGIGFVVQAPLSRLTPTQSYVINSVYSLFGNDVANNIFVLATFSDAISPPHVTSALDEANIQYNKMFKFNNSALYAETGAHNGTDSLNGLLWEMGMESFKAFFRELEKIDSVSLTLTKDVLNERKKLQILLEGLQTQIKYKFMNMEKLEHEEKMLIKFKNEIEKNENFRYLKPVTHIEMLPLESHELATNCHKCRITCHKRCNEFPYYRQCYAMVPTLYGYKCNICNCPISTHETSNSIYWAYKGTETVTIEKMKKEFDKAQSAQIKHRKDD